MPDEIDHTQEMQLLETECLIRQARQPIAAGEPGICIECIEPSARLVGGRCAPCRDNARKR